MPFLMVASSMADDYNEEDDDCYMNFSPTGKQALMAEEDSIELQQSNSNNLPQQRTQAIRTESDAPEGYKDKMDAPGTEELDLLDRDPTSLNTHVRVGFEEVFAEPYDMHSFAGIWATSYVVFVNAKFWCYRILSAFCGIPFALCWGVYFACLTFCHIWYVVPFLRGWVIALHYISRLWAICIRTFCDPFFESLGKIFSGFRIYMNRT
ncbi:caveolin-3-like isoform X2 [Amphiura filiformis]|uniref:caveolin-3-like isoform X2 n=1 Tax=Amphiura filiformis TaxID=82378 RepID=UPI003B21D321